MRTLPLVLGLALVIVAEPPSQADQPDQRSPLVAPSDSQASSTQIQAATADACPVSESVKDRPPDDPSASSFAIPNGTWYANDGRTMWAWWWGKRSVGDYKVLWIRPVGAQLEIRGRRLDRDGAPPLRAHIPAGYARHTYQASALDFPSAGCWEVNASAADARLTFVVRIR